MQHGGKIVDSMDLLDLSFKGNKNEIGQTLYTSMPIVCYADSTSDSIEQTSHTNMHTSLTFRGNKNGTGSKLRSMPQNNEMFMNRARLIIMRLMTNKQSQNSLMNVHSSHVTQHYLGTIPRLLTVLECYMIMVSVLTVKLFQFLMYLLLLLLLNVGDKFEIVLSKIDICP